MISGIESPQQVEHLARFRDWVADVVEVVGEGLEAGAVVGDAHVALLQRAELGFKVHSVLKLVVTEQALDSVLDGEGGGAHVVDDVRDTLVDGGAEPIHHTVVVEDPVGVALVQRRRGEDVRSEPELAEDGVEEAPPLAVVRLVEVEDDGHVRVDVDLLAERGEG
jgi:hypothetical protein